MDLLFRFILPFLVAPCLLAPIVGGLAIRDTSLDLSAIKGGVLVKNGKQTSCELGVIDSTAAFVAAPCLDFTENIVDRNTTYDVYLDTGIDSKSAKYTVESITVHPEYNSTTFLNPVAVLQFNKNSSENWTNHIAIDRNSSWGDVVLSRRGLADLDTMEWTRVLTVTNQYSDADKCSDYLNQKFENMTDTSVIDNNFNDILCSNATTYPPYSQLTRCSIPYGSVSTYISGKLYVAGIYVYTMMSTGQSKCRLFRFQSSVYVVFADYIAFASKVLGHQISYYPSSNDIAPQSNSEYSMNQPKIIAQDPLITYGDFYANQTKARTEENVGSSTDSAELAQSISGGSMETESNTYNAYIAFTDSVSSNSLVFSTDADTPNNEDSSISKDDTGSLSKKNILISVFCAILGGLMLAGIVLYVYDRYKRKRECANKVGCETQNNETQNENGWFRSSKYKIYINTFHSPDEK